MEIDNLPAIRECLTKDFPDGQASYSIWIKDFFRMSDVTYYYCMPSAMNEPL